METLGRTSMIYLLTVYIGNGLWSGEFGCFKLCYAVARNGEVSGADWNATILLCLVLNLIRST